MKNLFTIIVLFSLGIVFLKAQVKIGSKEDINTSLILDVDNSTNGGVLYPKVELGADLSNATSPILNPAEGLMVFNVNASGLQKEGVYIWFDGRWHLLADNNNMVNDLVVLNTSLNATALNSSISKFQNLNFLSLNEFSNNIPNAIFNADQSITLPKGSYVINVIIDFTASAMTSTDMITGANGVNLMNFEGKIYNPTTLETFGNTELINVTLRNQVKKGQISFNFNFNISETKNLVFALAHAPGGSFLAPITINQFKIHVQSAK